MNKAVFKEVINKYYDIEDLQIPDSELDYIDHDDYLESDCKFQVDSKIIWAVKQREYTKSLLNLFNQYIHTTRKLYHLDMIIDQYDSAYSTELRLEFTNIILDYCLSCPTVYSERLVYACIMLCHESNKILQGIESYSHKIIDETEINFSFLRKEKDEHKSILDPWSSVDELKNSLVNIGNRSNIFKDKTGDYRNREQHRLPQGLDSGLTQSIKAQKKELNSVMDEKVIKIISYSLRQKGFLMTKQSDECTEYQFIFEEPLLTKDMIPVLIEQGLAMKEAFYKYWALVEEQAAEISGT